MGIIRAIWHHVAISGDTFPHVYGAPTDCYCEPEIEDLGGGHRVVRHQDMTDKGESVWTKIKL